MSRPLRIQYRAATVCHVMNRGAARQLTFADDGDSQVFLDTLGEAHRLWGNRSFRLFSDNNIMNRVFSDKRQ